MKNGQQIRLLDNFHSRMGPFSYRKGQTGIVLFTCLNTNIIIDLDGYEDVRKAATEYKAKFGESINLVEYITEIPPELIEAV